MKVIDHIKNSNDTQFSYEIIPPLRGKGIKIVLEMVESLKKFNPPFIDVTSHASTVSLNKHGKKTKKSAKDINKSNNSNRNEKPTRYF